ncbi:MAG: hypothetical protein M3381_14980 [Actinomycetota bacterium]|nr:hypothetical protein [Actinomycetota bacterium]
MTRSVPDWGALQGAVSGDVVLPGSPNYESVRWTATVAKLMCGTVVD